MPISIAAGGLFNVPNPDNIPRKKPLRQETIPMTISNLRLLEGISQTLQSLEASIEDAYTRSTVQAAGLAADELRLRENTGPVRERYSRGLQLVNALLAETKGADNDLRQAVAALPTQLTADASWQSCAHWMEALLGVAQSVTLAQVEAERKTQASLSSIQPLLDWEAEGYRFTRPETTPVTAAEITAESVEAFIRGTGGDYGDARVTSFQPLRGGFSKQTVMLEVTTRSHGAEDLVLRGEGAVKLLGLKGQDISHEYHLLRYIHARGIRVAQPLWLQAKDFPRYLISRRVAGRVPGSMVSSGSDKALSDQMTKSLAEVLAAIHALPIDQGHPDIAASHLAQNKPLSRAEAQRRFIEEWTDHWRDNLRRNSPIAARAIRWVLNNVPEDTQPAALVHADCGFNNQLVHEDQVSALLDWEISHLGDPAEDLSWLMSGIPDKDTQQRFLAYYYEAGGSKVDAFRLKYYEVLASLKMFIAIVDIQEAFQKVPGATVQLNAFGIPYLQGPATTVSKLIEEAEKLRNTN